MSLPVPSHANVFWFLPTHGDGRYLATGIGGRNVNLSYLRQIAQAADGLGTKAFCCRPDAPARIPGWWRRRSHQ